MLFFSVLLKSYGKYSLRISKTIVTAIITTDTQCKNVVTNLNYDRDLLNFVTSFKFGTVCDTGHSLGGALATLAAFDMRQHLMNNGQGDARVVCYTFAAPRTGNHAFAREYNALVPDTFSIINDQVSFTL